MKRSIFIFGLFFLIAYSPAFAEFQHQITITPAEIEQGETLVITVDRLLPHASTTVQARVGTRSVQMFPYENFYIGFYSAPAKVIPWTYRATIAVDGTVTKMPVTIRDAKFPVTKLVVTDDLKDGGYSTSNIGTNLAENDTPAIVKALSRPAAAPYFSSAFQYPLDTIKNVGAFGNYRSSGGVMLQHLGVDLDAETGTPVYAINDGMVTMAKRLINYGNSIVIDHGAHIFSMSLHLDRFATEEGKYVKKGEIIGYSGNTGYSIAPHLHLSVNVNGTSIDPLDFIERTQKTMK